MPTSPVPSNEQPYKFLDDENIFICNICQCTYDSLRSMKTHIWKHSGHHNLSYPIEDLAIGKLLLT